MISIQKEEDKTYFPNLEEFSIIIFVNESINEDSMKTLNFWIEEIKKKSLENSKKILINIKKEGSQILESKNKINYENLAINFFEVSKESILDSINEIFKKEIQEIIKNCRKKNEDVIMNINTKNIITNTSEYLGTMKQYDWLINFDSDLFQKDKESIEKYSFLFNNDFGEKLFDLIEKLKDYKYNDLENIYDFIIFLKSEKNNLEEIITNLSFITYEKKNVYFASYYYYAINKLLNIYANYNFFELSQEKEKLEYYEQMQDENEKNEENKIEKDLNEENNAELKNIKNNLEEKMNNLKVELEKLNELYKKMIEKNLNINEDNNILATINLNIGITDTITENLKNLRERYTKLENILNNLKKYSCKFLRIYLPILSNFLSSTNKTQNYFYQKINNIGKIDKKDIEDFDDFVYFIFYYDFIKNSNKLNDIIIYFEEYFLKNNYENKTWKVDNFEFSVKNNKLIQKDYINQIQSIENCQNYCLKLIEKDKLGKHEYINQKYLWFLEFGKNNFFEKNKKIYQNFFQNILKKEEMKKLFIYIFPYLEEDYIINEEFIAEFFDKIKACNFIPEDSYGETLSSTLDVYIKNYFEKNDNVEQDICAMASFIIIIFHEFAHYTRIYIFKKTGNPKYRKSISLGQSSEIGEYLETLLFGKVILGINLYQAVFLLNENNYNYSYNLFKEKFMKLENEKDINNIWENFKFAKNILIKLKIYTQKSDIKSPSNYFTIKSGNKYFIIGNNNDKKGRSADLAQVFKGTPFEFLIKEQ